MDMDWLDKIAWGDVATWAQAAAAVVAVVVAVLSKRESRTAKVTADEAMELVRRRTAAQEQIAENTRPPKWEVEWRGGHTYALRNMGKETVTGVRIDAANLPPVTRALPDGVDLEAGHAHRFLMKDVGGHPTPSEILVTWDQQDAPQYVPVPARP